MAYPTPQALEDFSDLVHKAVSIRTVSITVPYGAAPGSKLLFTDAVTSQAYQVIVPPGLAPGSVFQAEISPAPPVNPPVVVKAELVMSRPGQAMKSPGHIQNIPEDKGSSFHACIGVIVFLVFLLCLHLSLNK